MLGDIEGFIKKTVRIKDQQLRIKIGDLLLLALMELPNEDRRLIMGRLKRIRSRRSTSPVPAFVQEIDEGYEIVINPQGFFHETLGKEEKKLEIIMHELEEIISFERRGESLHELTFIFGVFEGGKVRCSLCNKEIEEGYAGTDEEIPLILLCLRS